MRGSIGQATHLYLVMLQVCKAAMLKKRAKVRMLLKREYMKITNRIALLSTSVILISGCVPYQNSFNQTNANNTYLLDGYASTTTAQLKTKKESAVISSTKDAAKQNLKDPSSAQFRNVRIVSWGSQKLVCGEINAKNSYGGYVGFKRFVGSPTGVTIEPVSTRLNSLDEQTLRNLNQACGG